MSDFEEELKKSVCSIRDRVLLGIVLNCKESISLNDFSGKVKSDYEVYTYVSNSLKKLQWQFLVPITVIIYLIGFLSFLLVRDQIDILSAKKRASMIRIFMMIPFFKMLNKLVKALSYLVMFEIDQSPNK